MNLCQWSDIDEWWCLLHLCVLCVLCVVVDVQESCLEREGESRDVECMDVV